MDLVTHAVVGLAVAELSGHHASLTSSATIATVLGAIAPDFDIIARLRGELAYMRHHRAFSHSLPGVVAWTILINLFLHLLRPEIAWPSLLWPALAGGLSHILLDFFNTHGAALLWPFTRRRLSCYLLNVCDPSLLAALVAEQLLLQPPQLAGQGTFLFLILYITGRWLLRRRATHLLRRRLTGMAIRRLLVMPALVRLWHWDFVLETPAGYQIGEISVFNGVTVVHGTLPRPQSSPWSHKAGQTTLGAFFADFTPLLYWQIDYHQDRQAVRFYDLRYYWGNSFLHSGTVVFDQHGLPLYSYLDSCPFAAAPRRRENVPCSVE